MSSLDANLRCPSCQQMLRPALLVCDGCGIRVEGPFALNEFASLDPEDLHFLRIFVRSEGRVREMETALGLSYPTIRARITALKTKLFGADSAPDAPPAAGEAPSPEGTAAILESLQSGDITFEEAMQQLKQRRRGRRSQG